MIGPEVRAEFAALQKVMASPEGTEAEQDTRELRMRALWQHHGEAWLMEDLGVRPQSALGRNAVYENGHLHTLEVSLAKALEHQDRIGALSLHTLRLTGIDRNLDALTRTNVLTGVRCLDLGYGLETLSPDDLVRFLGSPHLGDLEALVFSAHEDVPGVWKALERFPRLGVLKRLGLQQIVVSPERARWLGKSLPALEILDCNVSLSGDSLVALAESATFTLKELRLRDSDGLHGREARLGDESIALALSAPMLQRLTHLSLFGCHARGATGAALSSLACGNTLERLNLGSQQLPQVVRALAGCTFPRLTDLSIRHNGLFDEDVDVLARFPTVQFLRVEKNELGPRALRTILARLPGLRELDICDSAIGDEGAHELAHKAPASLRRLDVSSTRMTAAAITDLAKSAPLANLRALNVACNELGKPAVRFLADGGFDKMASLDVSHTMRGDPLPLFEGAWLRVRREWLGSHEFERKLELSGAPVPRTTKPKGAKKDLDARDIDPAATYRAGEHVRHPEHGVGVVTQVHPLFVESKHPGVGLVRSALVPAGALPYDAQRRYHAGDVVLHAKFGAGIVQDSRADRMDIDFGVLGVKTLLQPKA